MLRCWTCLDGDLISIPRLNVRLKSAVEQRKNAVFSISGQSTPMVKGCMNIMVHCPTLRLYVMSLGFEANYHKTHV